MATQALIRKWARRENLACFTTSDTFITFHLFLFVFGVDHIRPL